MKTPPLVATIIKGSCITRGSHWWALPIWECRPCAVLVATWRGCGERSWFGAPFFYAHETGVSRIPMKGQAYGEMVLRKKWRTARARHGPTTQRTSRKWANPTEKQGLEKWNGGMARCFENQGPLPVHTGTAKFGNYSARSTARSYTTIGEGMALHVRLRDADDRHAR